MSSRSASPATTRGSSDRKSTRLNSSHVSISYAVFCLKKKIQPYHTQSAVTHLDHIPARAFHAPCLRRFDPTDKHDSAAPASSQRLTPLFRMPPNGPNL